MIAWHYAKLVIAIALVGLLIGSVAGERLGHGLTCSTDASTLPVPGVPAESRPLCDRRRSRLGCGRRRRTANALVGPGAVSRHCHAPAGADPLPQPPFCRIAVPPDVFRADHHGAAASRSLAAALAADDIRDFAFRRASRDGPVLDELVNFMIDTIFFRTERQDATVFFPHELGPGAAQAVAAMPGCCPSSPSVRSQVVLRHGHYQRRLSVSGYPAKPGLSRLLDVGLDPVSPPREGLLVSRRVAEPSAHPGGRQGPSSNSSTATAGRSRSPSPKSSRASSG